MCARVRRNFSPWPAGRCEGEYAAEGRKCVGLDSFPTRRSSDLDPLVEEPLSGGPTILFACPAQIPRSSLRSFSLWARHSAETSAELNVRTGAAEFFPVASRQVRG